MWIEKYSVGVKSMDDQHVNLIEIMNELHTAMVKGQAHSVAGPLLNKLTDYTHEHFIDEEKLMESIKYPGLADQRAEHRALAAKIEEFVAHYEQGDQSIYPQLLHFLDHWLVNHMQTADKKYSQWLNERGVH